MVTIIGLILLIVGVLVFYLKRRKGDSVPQGLQVFDENGNVLVDVGESFCAMYGSFAINTDTGQRAINIPRNQRIWFYIESSNHQNHNMTNPYTLKLSGNILSWKKTNSTVNTSIVVRYGGF